MIWKLGEILKSAYNDDRELFNQYVVLTRCSIAEVLGMDPVFTIKEQELDSFVKSYEKIIMKIVVKANYIPQELQKIHRR